MNKFKIKSLEQFRKDKNPKNKCIRSPINCSHLQGNIDEVIKSLISIKASHRDVDDLCVELEVEDDYGTLAVYATVTGNRIENEDEFNNRLNIEYKAYKLSQKNKQDQYDTFLKELEN